jgi:hypothetical protein
MTVDVERPPPLHGLQDHGHALPAANAGRAQGVPALAAGQGVRQQAQDARAAGAQQVPPAHWAKGGGLLGAAPS